MPTAFGVGVGDRLVLGTIGWDRLDEYLERSAAFVERTGPAIEVTVTGIHRSAVDIAQQDDPFVTLSRAFVERYGDRVINCPCIDNFDAAPGREDEALAAVGRVYEPLGYEVDLEEGGALPEHVANGIDVEVAAMWLLAVAAGIAGLVVVAQAIARHAAASAVERDDRDRARRDDQAADRRRRAGTGAGDRRRSGRGGAARHRPRAR